MNRARMSRIAMVGLAAVAIAAAGCARQPKEEKLPPAGDSTDFRSERPGSIEGEEVPEPQRVEELGSIYFDFDKYEIRDDAKPILQANARAILRHPEWSKITLEGHCDERGSEEYNLALGERRADTARRYLANLGVPAARMATVSFGENTPAVQGHDESAWRWNRRTEFRIPR